MPSVIAHASTPACTTDNTAKAVACSATWRPRHGTTGNRVASRNTNGSVAARRIQRGVVDERMTGQS